MKYAIGLFGIHYQKNLKHWMPGWEGLDVNYKNVLENNKEYLYGENDITFYSSTYFTEKLPELIDDFKFKKLQLTHMVNETETDLGVRWTKRNKRFKETIKLILEDGVEYDYVIIQRFDLFYKKSVFDYEFDYTKLNLICKSKMGNDVEYWDDNFYFLPYNLLKKFYDDLCEIPENVYSHCHNQYIKDYHYLINAGYGSHEIPIYVINRVPSEKES
jgi:hypothetical protein